jgi:hypothetical protein
MSIEQQQPEEENPEPRSFRWEGKRYALHACWWQQWGEWFTRGWNWKNFTLINVSFEGGAYKGGYGELTLGLLGLNCQIEIYDQADRAQKLAPVMDRLLEWRSREDREPWEQNPL